MDDAREPILPDDDTRIPPDDPEFTVLMERYMDSELSDEELVSLNDRLRGSPSSRVEFIHGLMQSAYLRVLVSQDRLAKSIAGIFDEETSPAMHSASLADDALDEFVVEAPFMSDSFSGRHAVLTPVACTSMDAFFPSAASLRRSAILPRYGKLFAGACGTAFLVILILLAIPTHSDKLADKKKMLPLPAVAVAEAVFQKDCEWFVDGKRANPRTLMSGSVVQLKKGQAEIEFESGVRVTLVGPVRFQAATKDRLVLVEGPAVARVPRTAAGFVIDTSAMRVTDLGTEFGVKSQLDGRAELHVFSGVVEVQLANGTGLRRVLRTGQSIAATMQQVSGILVYEFDEEATVGPAVFKRSTSKKAGKSKK